MTVGGTFIEQDDDGGPQGPRDKKLSLSSSQKPPNIIYLMTVLSAMGGFLFGYDTGIVGGAMVFVNQKFSLTSVWHGLIVDITILSAWLFSFAAGPTCDSYGRKTVILWASVIFTIGSVIMGAAITKWVLLVGRFVVGVAIGLASTAVPVYIAEVAPSNIRGSLVTLNNCFITFGQLAAAVTAGAFSYDKNNGWRWMLALASVPAIIQFVGFIFMPESPRWLLRKERSEDALKSLKQIRGEKNPYVLREFDRIRQNTNELRLQEEKRAQQNRNLIITILRRRATRRALTIGCVLMMAQQLAGINTVMYYTPHIIQMSGIQSDSAAVWLAVPTAAVYVVFSICGCLIADRMNRRTLLLGSLMGVMISLIILGGGFHLNTRNKTAVTAHKSDTNQTCFEASNCASCIDKPSCGFCFDPKASEAQTFCLEVNGDGRFAKDNSSQCSASNPESGYVFARRLCPQSNDGIGLNTWMVLIGLVLYLAFFAPGMAPMPWTINSEIYPMWARSPCYSFATSINWLTNLIVTFMFVILPKYMSEHSIFYMFAIVSGFFWIILFFELPETRGRSLDDISQLFAKRKGDDKEKIASESGSPDQGSDSEDGSPPLGFDQLALVTTQIGTGGHRHSIVLCHEDLVLASETIAAKAGLTGDLQEQQQAQAVEKQNQKTQAIAGAAAAAKEFAQEAAEKLASPLTTKADLTKISSSQQQQVDQPQTASQSDSKYSTDDQLQTEQAAQQQQQSTARL